MDTIYGHRSDTFRHNLAIFAKWKRVYLSLSPRSGLMEGMKRIPMTPILFVVLFGLSVLGLAGCRADRGPQQASASVIETLSGEVAQDFARAYAPMDFQFPLDHGPHDQYKTEWWYYTGNLSSQAGGLYGYQLTFFRSALSSDPPQRASDFATNQVYMAHFAVTDGPADRHYSFDRFSRGAEGLAGASGQPQYSVWLEDWQVEEVETGVFHLQARASRPDEPIAIDLLLQESRPPVLHGDRGLSQKGPEPGNASYYYSLVGLQTQGTVTAAGRTLAVTGLSWMDHEFGTSALSGDAVGWDWFSVQLDNGAVLMFAQIRSKSGQNQAIFEGTLLYPDGRQFVIHQDDFALTATGRWTSPTSGITYPSGWQVTFPAYDIALTIDPLIQDQEMDVTFVYYEGATRIEGRMAGEPVTGQGYVELTGYGDQQGAYQR